MKLLRLNPFIPKDESEQKIFLATYKRELQAYRKKPTFWVSLLIVLILSLIMIYRLDTTGIIISLPIVFGLALIHDTVTFYFIKRLVEIEKENKKTITHQSS